MFAASAASDRSGHSSPSALPIWATTRPQEHHAVAPLGERLAPRQLADAGARDTFGEQARGLVARLDLAGLLGKRERAEAARAARAQAQRFLVERHIVAALDAVREARLDLLQRDRRGQHDARVRGAAGEFGDRDERLARQRRGLIDIAAAPVGERERAIVAALRDAIRIGEREDRADAHLALPASGQFAPSLRHLPRIARAARTVAAEILHAVRQVNVVAAEPALGQHRRDVRRERARALARGIDHHAGETRRQRQAPQRVAFGVMRPSSSAPSSVKQRARLGERALRRRIEKRQRLRRGSPRREIEHEGG